MKYTYYTFKELFDEQIHYAYESQYGCHLDVEGAVETATFHKLYLNSIGEGQYKTSNFTFDPRLWTKVKALVELLQETTAEKILFGPDEEE